MYLGGGEVFSPPPIFVTWISSLFRSSPLFPFLERKDSRSSRTFLSFLTSLQNGPNRAKARPYNSTLRD